MLKKELIDASLFPTCKNSLNFQLLVWFLLYISQITGRSIYLVTVRKISSNKAAIRLEKEWLYIL